MKGNIYIMKQLVTSLCLLLLLIPQLPAETNHNQNRNHHTDQGMIEPALLYVVRRGYDDAVRNQADAIIFHMDTPEELLTLQERSSPLLAKMIFQPIPTLNRSLFVRRVHRPCCGESTWHPAVLSERPLR